jgi:glycosyltransferase involved in cell wall biosynthesis
LRLPGQSSSPAAASARVQSDFAFVGNFRHPPNADAARRLVQNIFPMILRQQPEATLTIVGADPPQDLVDAASDRVAVTGWVEDPSIYLAGAKVVLEPLRQGGGLRVKMLEACAAGKAIVASPMAVEGLSLRHDEDVRIAITEGEFAASALALMADPEARARLERASRRWWEDEHDSGRWSAQYADLYASLGKSG